LLFINFDDNIVIYNKELGSCHVYNDHSVYMPFSQVWIFSLLRGISLDQKEDKSKKKLMTS
jgi:hypothetical protein